MRACCDDRAVRVVCERGCTGALIQTAENRFVPHNPAARYEKYTRLTSIKPPSALRYSHLMLVSFLYSFFYDR